MKSSSPIVDKRAPLSQYLRAEDEDGWTIFSSDDVPPGDEAASRPERSPNLSVLKQIKNFLCDETVQENSFLSSDEERDARSFRVDYPFYDSGLEDEFVETPPAATETETKTSARDPEEESARDEKSEKAVEKTPDVPRRETAAVVPQTPIVQESDEPNVPSLSGEEETPAEEPALPNESLETAPTPESQSAENVAETRGEMETTPDESARGELVAAPCVEERIEEAPDETPEAPTSEREESATLRPFVVDFSETLAPVLERRARGEELEEPPLIQAPARRSRRVGKESTAPATFQSGEPRENQTETPEARIDASSFERERRASDGRMAIFRRCVELVSRQTSRTNVSTSEEIVPERPTSTFESDEFSAPAPWNDAFDYGESVAYVAAPCFGVFPSVASLATTATFDASSR